MRLAFMGTPDFSVPTLRALVEAGHEIVAVYTRAPQRAGRGQKSRTSPVHDFAESQGLTVLTPPNFRDDAICQEFIDLDLDAAVIVAYGHILPQSVLSGPKHGCFNIHASLLPRWRGAAPIQRAIMAGDRESGVMVMQMEEGLDTGPICLTARTPIGPDMTARELHDELSALGGPLMVKALAELENGQLESVAQPETGVTYAKKIAKAEARIMWAKPADEVHNHIRGLSPFPGAWFELPSAKGPVRVKVLRSTVVPDLAGNIQSLPGTLLSSDMVIACKEGAIKLLEVQRAGKAPMSADEFARGAALTRGQMLDISSN